MYHSNKFHKLKSCSFISMLLLSIFLLKCNSADDLGNSNNELKGTWELKSMYLNTNEKLPFDKYTITLNGETSTQQATGQIEINSGIIPIKYEYYNSSPDNRLNIYFDYTLFPPTLLNNSMIGLINVYIIKIKKSEMIAISSSALPISGGRIEIINYQLQRL